MKVNVEIEVEFKIGETVYAKVEVFEDWVFQPRGKTHVIRGVVCGYSGHFQSDGLASTNNVCVSVDDGTKKFQVSEGNIFRTEHALIESFALKPSEKASQ